MLSLARSRSLLATTVPAFCAWTFCAWCLVGCTTATQPTAIESMMHPGVTIQGNVEAGTEPLRYAVVRLMETPEHGGEARVLTAARSDARGNFSFDNYAGCDPGRSVYAVATSEAEIDTGSKQGVIELGVVGSCSIELAHPQSVLVGISQRSTAAAVYALQRFIRITFAGKDTGPIVNISAPPERVVRGGRHDAGRLRKVSPPRPQAVHPPPAAELQHGFADALRAVDSVRYDGSLPTGLLRELRPTDRSPAWESNVGIRALGSSLDACMGAFSLAGGAIARGEPAGNTLCGRSRGKASASDRVARNSLRAALDLAADLKRKPDAKGSLPTRRRDSELAPRPLPQHAAWVRASYVGALR